MIHAVVWVLIQSPMSFSAPEGHFLEGIPKNGQSYKNFDDFSVRFVQYPYCICYFPCISPELLLKSQIQCKYWTNPTAKS